MDIFTLVHNFAVSYLSQRSCLFSSSLDFTLTKNCTLTVTLRHSVRFMVIRHTKVWRRRHDQQDYLGFYTLDSHHMSASVHGLLGRELPRTSLRSQWSDAAAVCWFLRFYNSKDFFPQVSSITGLGLRWQNCVQVTSRINQMPPCMWRDKRSTWPGALVSSSWNTRIMHARLTSVILLHIVTSPLF